MDQRKYDEIKARGLQAGDVIVMQQGRAKVEIVSPETANTYVLQGASWVADKVGFALPAGYPEKLLELFARQEAGADDFTRQMLNRK